MIKRLYHCILAWLTPKCHVCKLPKVKVFDFAIDYRTGMPVTLESYECPTSHGSKDNVV